MIVDMSYLYQQSYFSTFLQDMAYVAVIFSTKMETLNRFTDNADDYHLLEDFVDAAITYHLEEVLIKKTIEIRKQIKIKLPDAIIAATTWCNDFTLITRNKGDFKKYQPTRILKPT